MATREDIDRLHDTMHELWQGMHSLRSEMAAQALQLAVLQKEFSLQKSGNASIVAFCTSIISSIFVGAILFYLKLK